MIEYRCLNCGGVDGEPASEGYCNWYWRILQFGRLGPFCSEPCSREFRLSGDATFTLLEWERLRFVKATCMELAEREPVDEGVAYG